MCWMALERQGEDLDPDFVTAKFHTDLFADPETGQTFHPGVTYAVGTFIGRRIIPLRRLLGREEER